MRYSQFSASFGLVKSLDLGELHPWPALWQRGRAAPERIQEKAHEIRLKPLPSVKIAGMLSVEAEKDSGKTRYANYYELYVIFIKKYCYKSLCISPLKV
jgi:hypothetical protein